MKKILKIIGVIFATLIVIGLLAGGGNDKSSSVEEAFKGGEEKAREVIKEKFTEEDALKKIQDYQITTDLKSPDIPAGTTILEVYEIKGEIPAVENLGWFTEEIEEGKHIVGYKQMISENLPQEPRWEVTKDSIKALNGKAITITPEFGPKEKETEGNEFEKEVYETCKGLFKKYTDEVFEKYELPTAEQLDEAERRALEETAEKFGITPEEVEEVYTRLDMGKYQ